MQFFGKPLLDEFALDIGQVRVQEPPIPPRAADRCRHPEAAKIQLEKPETVSTVPRAKSSCGGLCSVPHRREILAAKRDGSVVLVLAAIFGGTGDRDYVLTAAHLARSGVSALLTNIAAPSLSAAGGHPAACDSC